MNPALYEDAVAPGLPGEDDAAVKFLVHLCDVDSDQQCSCITKFSITAYHFRTQLKEPKTLNTFANFIGKE